MGVGFMEGFLIVPLAIIYTGLPIVTLVLVALTYRKIRRIEEKLGR